uniref:DUF4371 domain-containing protein n=1 Tax=Latimeria chalumnae TaxID=7897 RepID=H3AU67_LATCH
REWFFYSPNIHLVFCRICLLFRNANTKGKLTCFTRDGFSYWKDGKQLLEEHELSIIHLDAVIATANYATQEPINFLLSAQARQKEICCRNAVMKNQDVLVCLIDVVLFLAKQGLPFRGHEEDAEDVNLNHGNFLELVALLAKYDRVLGEHLKKVINQKTSKSITFLSPESQNKLISNITDEICQAIVTEVQEAGNFSITMDCTTDIAHQDQALIVMRYVRSDLCVVEHLLEVVHVEDSSAEGLFNILGTLASKGVDLQHVVSQSYDRAVVMSGQHAGVRALIQKENPNCLYIWTFDHALNLVIMQACSASLPAKQLFGLLEQIYNFFTASHKRSDVPVEVQTRCGKSPIHQPQHVSTTRWWSHQKALSNVFFACEKKLFDCLMDALEECQSTGHSLETVCEAEGLHKNLTSFETVLLLICSKKIFDITVPASKYLQSESIDLLQAVNLVENCQLNCWNSELYESSVSFCERHDLEDVQFPEVRVPKRKRMDDEMAHDETMTSTKERYRVNTFLLSLDVSISCMKERLQILSDFILLTPSHFSEQEGVLPKDAFNICADRYGFNKEALQKEYVTFVKAYPRLSKMYKILVTLPVGSTKCEHCFSKLKLIKTHLRSTMSSECLASLIMIAVERSLIGEIDPSSVISQHFLTMYLKRDF